MYARVAKLLIVMYRKHHVNNLGNIVPHYKVVQGNLISFALQCLDWLLCFPVGLLHLLLLKVEGWEVGGRGRYR